MRAFPLMLACCLLVSGCRLSWERAHDAVDRIAVGNAADTVRLILGEPDVIRGREDGPTAWIYCFHHPPAVYIAAAVLICTVVLAWIPLMAAESMPSAHHARFQLDAQQRVVAKQVLTGCGCAK